MSSKFIISLDFELMWGVRDHRSVADYGDAVMGARSAVPRLLELFDTFGIQATWATVGLLFARNQREMAEFAPEQHPTYSDTALDPYPQVAALAGQDESTAPHFFARSLLDRVIASGSQEIACHTYSHYFCLEPGQTVAQFSADLEANKNIAADAGCAMRSIVFCRNQWREEYIDAAVEAGLDVFRGNQDGYIYRSRAGARNTLLIRGLRLLDGALPVNGPNDFAEATRFRGGANVPASRFLRPWSPKTALYNVLHQRSIKSEMTRAAKAGRHYHLWWHPHNMGRYSEANFAQLETILTHFRDLKDCHGMESTAMGAMGEAALVDDGSN
ncbi:polysaccharide deacetylase family protein [Qipengyuania sp. CAU 1752]